MSVLALFKNIRLFVLDVDGVLTDGSLLILNDGQMARRMNIKDGYALQLAIRKGYRILVISGGHSEAVKERLLKLGVQDVYMSVTNKKEKLIEYTSSGDFTWDQVLYMGDDIPDLIPMQMAGLACCPHDAVNEVRSVSHYISHLKGGEGCVRDVIEKVMKLNDDWNEHEGISSR